MDSGRMKFIPEEKITDASGKIRWLQTVKIPILQSDSSACQVLGVSTDITERKRSEQLQSALYRIAQAASAAQKLRDLFKRFMNDLEHHAGK